MKLAVIGSRDFHNYQLLAETLAEFDISVIISGGARGADRMAEQYAASAKVPLSVIHPDWKKYGRKAPLIRNYEIVKQCDQVIAFWNGVSTGTAHTLDIALRSKKPVTIIKYSNT